MLWSKLTAVILMQTVLSYALGRAGIPVLRKLKTGLYEPYIGDRFAADGSEPAFGGAVMWIVFAFGSAVVSAVCGEPARFAAAAVYILAVTAAGVLDDFMTDVRHKPYGVKRGIKLAYCYAASLAFLPVYKKLGYLSTEILLPFRWGAVDLGAAFYPLTAAVMTVLISAFGLFNRFGTDEESCVGGLCQTVLFVQSAALAVVGDVTDDGGLTAFGYICAAAVGGSLIWGLSPAKLRSGSSGGYFCGAAAAAALCFTERLGLAVLVSCIAAAVDCACTAVQYLVYRISKKLVLKGSSLHSHMSRSGMNDYKIIAVFSLIAAAGGVLAVMYAAYSVKVTL